jgi:hypothetical protein
MCWVPVQKVLEALQDALDAKLDADRRTSELTEELRRVKPVGAKAEEFRAKAVEFHAKAMESRAKAEMFRVNMCEAGDYLEDSLEKLKSKDSIICGLELQLSESGQAAECALERGVSLEKLLHTATARIEELEQKLSAREAELAATSAPQGMTKGVDAVASLDRGPMEVCLCLTSCVSPLLSLCLSPLSLPLPAAPLKQSDPRAHPSQRWTSVINMERVCDPRRGYFAGFEMLVLWSVADDRAHLNTARAEVG